MIEDSVAFLRGEGVEVIYDAEHFFDGYRAQSRLCAGDGAGGGARRGAGLVLCDTNGGSLPAEVREGARLARTLACRSASTRITTPNSPWPTRWPRWRKARRMVQGTINGYGERCGNANLCSHHPQRWS